MEENTTSLRDILHSGPEKFKYNLQYLGKGSEFFSVVVVNWLLTLLTLGFYYPWAKARKLQYLYSSTDFLSSRFIFHGTGKEMFKGFIKALIVLGFIYALMFYCLSQRMIFTGILVLYGGLVLIIPLAIHGSYRYRMSRTSWRGIRMGYRGTKTELASVYFKGIFLTIVTLGIYGAWLTINLRKYILGNIRLGNLKFKYKGNGGDFFVLNLKGYFLSILTLFIYSFWWQKDLFNYYVNNMEIEDENGNNIVFKSTATGGGFFKLIIVNLLMTIFTFGLAYPWVVTRTLKYIFSSVEMEGSVDMESVVQSEGNYTDATGDDITDLLDFDFVI